MLSIWQRQSFYYPTDIIIVGGGLSGLLTAISLKVKARNLSVRILEKGAYPEGASVKNAGFACFGSLSEILDDSRQMGMEAALELVKKRYRGLKQLIHMVGASVDLQDDNGFEVFTETEKDLFKESIEQLAIINDSLQSDLGFAPYSIVSNNFGFNSLDKLIAIKGEASLHSGKLLSSLIKLARSLEVEISFGTEVSSFQKTSRGWEVKSSRGIFSGEQLVFTLNGFTQKLFPDQPICPARGQLLLTAPIAGLQMAGNFHLHQGYYYFRAFEGGILLGGGRHLDRTNETTTDQNTSEIIQHALEGILKNTILPGREFKIERRWAGTMAFGPNNEKHAIIKELEPQLFIGARLGGMGVAMSPLLADELSDLILGR